LVENPVFQGIFGQTIGERVGAGKTETAPNGQMNEFDKCDLVYLYNISIYCTYRNHFAIFWFDNLSLDRFRVS